MDPSNSQYQAMMNTHSLQGVVLDQYCSSNSKKHQEKTQRPQPEALKCPRCDSGNTKFCYYNNYSLTQPRYFCKACRRYWTKGGSLRNVPVGGGVRKNHSIIKKSSTASSKLMMKSSSSSTTTNQSDHDQQAVLITNKHNNSNPLLFNLPNISSTNYDTNDLTLAFGRLHKQQTPTRQQFGFDDYANNNSTIFGNPKTTHFDILGNPNTTSGFIDALRSGFLDAPSTNNGFQNLYDYGNMEEVENSSGGGGVASHDQQGMGLPYEEINSVKEELLKSEEGIRENINGDQNRVLWNFPWEQFGTDQDQGSAGTGRDINQCWNNGTSLGSSWHGLVNTTL